MKNVIKILKDNMLGFILGAILFGGITTVLATTILSSSVSYTNNNQTTVEGSLNELYIKASMLNSWIDPRGLNTDGNGGKISFVYWNDNFDGTSCTSTQAPIGTGLNGTYESREQLATAYSNWSNIPIYMKTTKVNGTVTGHAACLWYNNREFCIAPNYWTGTIGVSNATEGANTKAKLKADMEDALGITIADSSCDSSTSRGRCRVGDFFCNANYTGSVSCNLYSALGTCYVFGIGNAYCSDS